MAKGLNEPGVDKPLLSEFDFTAPVNPVDVGVNLRFKSNVTIHPRARTAMGVIIVSFRQACEDVWLDDFRFDLGTKTDVQLDFFFGNNRGDIDGPIKRTLDAIQSALQSMYYDWNDRRVVSLGINKHIDKESPRIEVQIRKMD